MNAPTCPPLDDNPEDNNDANDDLKKGPSDSGDAKPPEGAAPEGSVDNGSIEEIPRPGGLSQEPNPPEPTAIEFQIGDLVSPADRDNLGSVIALSESACQVRFVDRESGQCAEKWFGFHELRLVRRAGGSTASIVILSYPQVLALRPPPYLVENLLRVRELAVLFAEPGVGKSFIALDLCMSIVAKDSWRGHRVANHGILYVAAEGVYGLRSRALAWQREFNPDVALLEAGLKFVGEPIQLLDDEQFQKFLGVLGGLPSAPGLIVIDTLARCAAGGDENSARDMGELIKRCDAIRQKVGCAILLVHHSQKGGPKERGSGAIRGAADVMLQLTRDAKQNTLVLVADKVKDGPSFEPLTLRLREVAFPDGESGEPLRSCVLEVVRAVGPRGRDPLKPSERTFVEQLWAAFRTKSASKTVLKGVVRMPDSTFYAACIALEEKGYLESSETGNHEKYRLSPKGLSYARANFGGPTADTDTDTAGPVQSNESPPPKGGVDSIGLDCTDPSGQNGVSSPVQGSPNDQRWTLGLGRDDGRVDGEPPANSVRHAATDHASQNPPPDELDRDRDPRSESEP